MRSGIAVFISGVVAAPLLTQTAAGTRIAPAFTARESTPAFVVECRNDSASAVPWPTIRGIRLDGEARERVGGVVGSVLGMPGERFEVAPGAVYRLLLVLSPVAESRSSSPGPGLGVRVRQPWIVPMDSGTHRIAVECLGQWSDEITFVWSADAPLER